MTDAAGSAPASDGPLAGLRVVELANLYAGPLVGAMLGDLGADVVKVEPPEGEPFRSIVERDPDGGPGVFTLVTRNKRMIAIDDRRPEGVELLGRLTAVADVVVVNQPRPVLERLGCTYETLAARNPRVVMVDVTGWGEGPYEDRGGNGTIAEAFAGLTEMLRADDGDHGLSAALLGDCLTALAGTIGTLAACYWRAVASGEGQYIEVPMYEAVLTAVAPQITGYRPDAPARDASGLRRSFRTGDGRWVVATAYTTAQIGRLLAAVGVDTSGPDHAPGPPTDASILTELVKDWVAGHDLETVVAAFGEARIPITPMNDVGAVLADPHVRARGAVVDVDTPTHGRVRVPRPTPRLHGSPARLPGFAERPLGADGGAVCAEWLGLDDDEVARLHERGALA